MRKFFILVMALSLGFISCKKDKSEEIAPDIDPADVVGTWTISSNPGVEVVFNGGAEYEQILKDSLAWLFHKDDVYTFNAGTSCSVTRGGASKNVPSSYQISKNTITLDGYIKFVGTFDSNKTVFTLKAGKDESKVILEKKLKEKGIYTPDEISSALKYLQTSNITLILTKSS